MTLAELQTKRDEIVRSLGVLKIQFGERSVEYGRQVEALAAIDREIARLSEPQERVFQIKSSRGLE